MFERYIVKNCVEKLENSLPDIQAIIGPRQVGKTTAAHQIAEKLKLPFIFETADTSLPPGPEWIESHWRRAQRLADDSTTSVLLILDEIQKVQGWSDVLKKCWDLQSKAPKIKCIILGSSALLMQSGLRESLSGRFYLHRLTHWTYPECKQAFNWNFSEWLYFGGYPGGVRYIGNESEWKNYVKDSLIETVLAKDVLQHRPIRKPALLRQLFMLSAAYPSQILSYTNMLGQLQDAGNTTTLADYLQVLGQAFLISGLESFSKREIRKRGSSPKLILWNNALVNAISLKGKKESQEEYTWWGRVVENAVGATLLNELNAVDWEVTYWREHQKYEVDFVISHGTSLWALEIKSGRKKNNAGLEAFRKQFPTAKTLLIGESGIPVEEFLSYPILEWLNPKA